MHPWPQYKMHFSLWVMFKNAKGDTRNYKAHKNSYNLDGKIKGCVRKG